MDTVRDFKANDGSPRPAQHMTGFGRTLYSLMLTRGVENRQDLQRLLNDGGYKISQPQMSYFFNGKRTVDPVFFACVSELLGLNKEERRRLSWAYAHEQLRLSAEQLEMIEGFKDAF